jgi:predicted RNase H-like HicB family nuclease
MRYTVVLEPTKEPDQPGWYYAHIPALDLTTHGLGIEGALEAAKDLVSGWIEELKSRGEKITVETQSFVGHIEVSESAIHSAGSGGQA